MCLMQVKMQEGRKKRLSVPATVEKRKSSVVQTMIRDIAFWQSCRLPAFSEHIPENNQNSVIQMCPSVRERTKNAQVGNRHHIPHLFLDLGGWYKTLMTGRIADLFLTQAGFVGHAQQIEQELGRLIEALPYIKNETDLLAVDEYVKSIKGFIIKKAKKAPFDFPLFLFHFPYESVLSVKNLNRILYINGKRQGKYRMNVYHS